MIKMIKLQYDQNNSLDRKTKALITAGSHFVISSSVA